MTRFIIFIFSLLMAGAAVASSPQAAPAFGLVDLSAANLRSEPRQAAELATQASFGTPVRILDASRPDWIFVELPDGYQAWAERFAIAELTPDMYQRWLSAPRLVVTSMTETHVIADSLAGPVPDNIVTDAVLGSIFEGLPPEPGAEYVAVALPDGRFGFIPSAAVEPLDLWAQTRYNPQAILSVAYALMGVPYLWGGTTTKGVDCSGLVKTAFFASALILPRNASDQARCGIAIDPSAPRLLEPADLLFFPSEDKPESDRITHVAIYDGNKMYVHASGRVRVNSFDPLNRRYLNRPLIRAVRIALPERELQGAVRVADHPWYFAQ